MKKFVAGDKTDNFILGVGWGSIRESELKTQKSFYSIKYKYFLSHKTIIFKGIGHSKIRIDQTLLQNSDLFFEKWSFEYG